MLLQAVKDKRLLFLPPLPLLTMLMQMMSFASDISQSQWRMRIVMFFSISHPAI